MVGAAGGADITTVVVDGNTGDAIANDYANTASMSATAAVAATTTHATCAAAATATDAAATATTKMWLRLHAPPPMRVMVLHQAPRAALSATTTLVVRAALLVLPRHTLLSWRAVVPGRHTMRGELQLYHCADDN